MKFFKYKRMKKIRKIILKNYIASLENKEAIKLKRNMLLQKIISILGLLMLIIFLLLFIVSKTLNEKGLTYVLINVGIIVGVILTLILCGYLFCKFNYSIPTFERKLISSALYVLRDYYKLGDNYLITKCFKSSNTNFDNHDVTIFRVGDEIRITGDIVNGFMSYYHDLGCYRFKISEIELYKTDYNNRRVTVLKVDKFEFIMGIKAYSFINKLKNIKVFNNYNKRIELEKDHINFVTRKNFNKILLTDILEFQLKVPKYSGIPGSLYSYDYEFKVKDNLNKMFYFNMILETQEQKELIKYLTDNNVKLDIMHIDNKYKGD